jgi:hypothetical protein
MPDDSAGQFQFTNPQMTNGNMHFHRLPANFLFAQSRASRYFIGRR